MEKKILYIDMDGVTADFEQGVIQRRVTRDPERKETKVPEGFFENLLPIEGAVEAIHSLEEFYNIYFLSTPQWTNPNSYKEKRLWIEKYFPELGFKKLILSHNKALLKGDYLIDDWVHEGFEGEHIHFGTDRFPDWETVVKYLTSPSETSGF